MAGGGRGLYEFLLLSLIGREIWRRAFGGAFSPQWLTKKKEPFVNT